MYDALRDLAPFMQFKKHENHSRGRVTEPATLLRETLLHKSFSCFLNCKNGTNSGKASHICDGKIISIKWVNILKTTFAFLTNFCFPKQGLLLETPQPSKLEEFALI